MLSFQLFTQLNYVIAVENILTRANYFNLSDPTVVLYWRAGGGLEISKRNRGIPPLVQAIPLSDHGGWVQNVVAMITTISVTPHQHLHLTPTWAQTIIISSSPFYESCVND